MKISAAEMRKAADCLDASSEPLARVAHWLRLQAAQFDGAKGRGASKTPCYGARPETVERFKRIDALWNAGLTVYQIGEAERLSASSVSGYIWRARKLFDLCKPRAPKVIRRPPNGTQYPAFELPINFKLHGRFKGEKFEAVVTSTGICVTGVGTFKSLSTAAMSALESRCHLTRLINGWDFWRVNLDSGFECRVSNLRTNSKLAAQAIAAAKRQA